MANWFGSSAGLLKGRAPDAPQPFEIDCECGQRHTGLRRQHHQRIICKSCGSAIFILPKDVYPASSESPPVNSAKVWSDEAYDNENVFDETEAEVDDAPPKAKRKTAAKPEKKSSPPAATTTAKSPPQELPAPKPARPKRAKPQGPLITPLRLVAGAMLVIVAVTAFFVVRNQRLEDAKRRLAQSIEQFNEAVTERDWPMARNRINEVVECLDILDRHDMVALRHRQFHREIKAMNDLASSSLFDILEESDANEARNPNDWQATFNSHHAGRWLVMELPARRGEPIKREDEDSDAAAVTEPELPQFEYEFSFPISVGHKNRFVDIDLEILALDKLAWEDTGRSVVVAAQLSSMQLAADGSHWTVTFEPSTAFLWANTETYEGVGFEFSEWNPRAELEALLAEQAVAIGIEPPPEPSSEPAPDELALNQEVRE